MTNMQWCSRGERGGAPFPQIFFGERHSSKWYQNQGKWWYSSVLPSRLAKKCKIYGRLIIEIVATRCHILKLKHIATFHFGWGSAPDRPRPHWWSLQRSRDPLAGFKRGPLLRERERRKDGRERQGNGRGKGRRKGKGSERKKGKTTSKHSLSSKFATTALLTYRD